MIAKYEFRPHSSFFYLQGFQSQVRMPWFMGVGDMTLVTLPKDPEKDKWDGFRFRYRRRNRRNFCKWRRCIDWVNVSLLLIGWPQSSMLLFMLIFHFKGKNRYLAQCVALALEWARWPPTKFLSICACVREMRFAKRRWRNSPLWKAAAQLVVEAHKQGDCVTSSSWNEMSYQLEAELN